MFIAHSKFHVDTIGSNQKCQNNLLFYSTHFPVYQKYYVDINGILKGLCPNAYGSVELTQVQVHPLGSTGTAVWARTHDLMDERLPF